MTIAQRRVHALVWILGGLLLFTALVVVLLLRSGPPLPPPSADGLPEVPA